MAYGLISMGIGIGLGLVRWITGTVIPPVTYYLLQEDGSSRFILEDGTGFVRLE